MMDWPKRKQNRLKSYDYSTPGYYFVTICTQHKSCTLGAVIAWYKYQVTRQVNECCGTAGERIFQRSYHDHIIRGEKDYLKIWDYIEGNPSKWQEDCFYVEEQE